jgi:hypothetical protein
VHRLLSVQTPIVLLLSLPNLASTAANPKSILKMKFPDLISEAEKITL